MKTANVIIITLVIVMAGVFVALSGAKNKEATLPINEGDLVITAADHAKGPETAPVTLVEFSDFQCPACNAYYPLLKDLKTELGDDIRIVYKNFPLRTNHPNAQIAAQAAEAAGLQGKFWEMHDLLFENQAAWSDLSNRNAKETFEGYATTLGLDMEQYNTDIDSDVVKQKIQTDVDTGNKLAVTGTPTFFVNGQPFANPRSYQALLESMKLFIQMNTATVEGEEGGIQLSDDAIILEETNPTETTE